MSVEQERLNPEFAFTLEDGNYTQENTDSDDLGSDNYPERPKTSQNDNMRMTFDQFFKKANTPNKGSQASKNKSLNTDSKSSSKQKSLVSNRMYKDVGIEKLNKIKKHLDLNPKKSNILDPKILESWINETITEVERLEDRKDGIPLEKKNPLKRYGIDRQALENIGLDKDSIDRLFRCMFVYTAGFYEMINNMFDHTNKKFTFVSGIWKVFWILLEYCYKADHQTILEVVNQENREHLERITKELQAKSQELNDLIAWKEKYLDDYQKTLDSLILEKESLMRENAHLQEDCKINEKAYTDEVQLRIKFENKINDFYANYRDLQAKNQRLLDELVSLQTKNENLSKINNDLMQRISGLNDRNHDLGTQLRAAIDKSKDKETVIEELSKDKGLLEKKLLQSLNANQEVEKKKLQGELDSQKFKLNSMYTINDMYKRNIDEMKKIIEDKSTEIDQLNDKLDTLEEQYKEKNKENLENEQLKVQYKEKSELLEKQLKETKAELEVISAKFDALQLKHSETVYQLEAEQDKLAAVGKDQESSLGDIQELKEARSRLEHKLQQTLYKLDDANKQVKEMENKVDQIKEQKSKLEAFIVEQKDNITELENDIEKRKKEMKNTKTDFYKVEEHLKELINKEKANSEQWARKFEKEQQRGGFLADKLVGLERKIQEEVQEKEEVKIKYYEAEKNGESLEKALHEVRKHLSEMTKLKEYNERELKLVQHNLEEYRRESTDTISKLEIDVRDLKISYDTFYHPMIVEDLLSRLNDMRIKVKRLDAKYLEESYKNSNVNYKLAKRKILISKLKDISEALVEERRRWMQEKDDMLYEALRTKNKEQLMVQQIEGLNLEIRELKQNIQYLENNKLRLAPDRSGEELEEQDQEAEDGEEPIERVEKHRRHPPGGRQRSVTESTSKISSIDDSKHRSSEVTMGIAMGYDGRRSEAPSSDEIGLYHSKSITITPNQGTRSVSQSRERIEKLPQRPSTTESKHRRQQQNQFKIRKTTLQSRSLFEDDKSKTEEEDYSVYYQKIEELFDQKFSVEQILELAKQQHLNSGYLQNTDNFVRNIKNVSESQSTETMHDFDRPQTGQSKKHSNKRTTEHSEPKTTAQQDMRKKSYSKGHFDDAYNVDTKVKRTRSPISSFDAASEKSIEEPKLDESVSSDSQMRQSSQKVSRESKRKHTDTKKSLSSSEKTSSQPHKEKKPTTTVTTTEEEKVGLDESQQYEGKTKLLEIVEEMSVPPSKRSSIEPIVIQSDSGSKNSTLDKGQLSSSRKEAAGRNRSTSSKDRSQDLKLPIRSKVSRGESMEMGRSSQKSEGSYNPSMGTTGQAFGANRSQYEESKGQVIEEGTEDSRRSDALVRELNEKLGPSSKDESSPYDKQQNYQNLKNITQQLSTMKKSGGERAVSRAGSQQQSDGGQLPQIFGGNDQVDLRSVVEALKNKNKSMTQKPIQPSNMRQGMTPGGANKKVDNASIRKLFKFASSHHK